jgi:hypothetical protein
MGGIVAHYPTRVEFHYPSRYLPAGRDMFGEVLKLAHARGIRVIGRFDLSKTDKRVWETRPEWFFRRANGEPVVYNGLYSACINGGYYREQAQKILTEALERYDVDGLFFNMFGNQSSDYSGRPVGICQCDSCKQRFAARFGHALPAEPDNDYTVFMFESSRAVAERIGRLIREKRPAAGFFTYIQEHTDGIMSESNTAVNRPLPLWPHASSDNVNRARNSQPGKMAVNLCMSFVDFPWRFATVPQNEIRLRTWQNVANGGAAALNMHGTMNQQDRRALEAAKPIYRWLRDHEELYRGQESAARVVLLGRDPKTGQGGGNAYRGFFRLLSEQHIPFAVSDNLDCLGRDFDLVIAAHWAPAELDGWIRKGGRLLVASPKPPALDFGEPVRLWRDVQGYFRIRDHTSFPSLKSTNLLMLNGDYAEYPALQKPLLTLIPPSMFGPPEKVHVDMVETDKPGLLIRNVGKGRVAWLPWDVAGLYYRHGNEGHSGILKDLIDGLLPRGRQIVTDAHPLVEMTLMRQGSRRMLHLVNLSGHADIAYFDPVPMRDIRIRVVGSYSRARAAVAGQPLEVTRKGEYGEIVLPLLEQYEVIVLE